MNETHYYYNIDSCIAIYHVSRVPEGEGIYRYQFNSANTGGF